MRRLRLAALLAPFFVLFTSLPAKAYLPPHDEQAYEAAVVACMEKSRAEPVACLVVVMSPCDGQPWVWGSDTCRSRLTKRWREKKDSAQAANPFFAPFDTDLLFNMWYVQLIQSRVDARHPACRVRAEQLPPIPDAPGPDWLGACVVFDFADWWFMLTHRLDEVVALREAHLAEVESLEACVLESGAAGQADQCIGLFGDLTCEGLSPTCGTSEFFVFVEILHSSIGADAAQAVLSDVGGAVAAGEYADCSDFNECMKKHFARRAIDAFLAEEARD